MKISKEQYSKMTDKKSPPSNFFKNILLAFVTGGAICTFGQLLYNLYYIIGLTEKSARGLVSVSLIFLSVFLTALDLYKPIASFAGAGTLVPITGFANAVASASIEYKTEGHILGIGGKMFSIAGPVILFGSFASFIYGVIFYLIKTFV